MAGESSDPTAVGRLTPEDHVLEALSYRDPQTVALLGGALRGLAGKRDEGLAVLRKAHELAPAAARPGIAAQIRRLEHER